jgi:hypothetical protein
MPERSYETRLVNDAKRVLMVYEADGPLVELQPGQDFTAESRNPMTMYARWSEVKWHQDGKVSFVVRTNFTEPERGRWVIRLLNKDGEAVERRVIGEKPVILPKGIPVLTGMKLDDPLVKHKALTIIKKRVPVKDEEHPGYLLFETISKDETELRDAPELKYLKKLLEEKHEG